jgi:hypothetical protein
VGYGVNVHTAMKIPYMYSQKRNCAASTLIFHIYASVRDLYIPGSVCLFCCRKICGLILGKYKSLTHMNVEIGTEAAQFLLGIIFFDFQYFVFGMHFTISVSFTYKKETSKEVRRF